MYILVVFIKIGVTLHLSCFLEEMFFSAIFGCKRFSNIDPPVVCVEGSSKARVSHSLYFS